MMIVVMVEVRAALTTSGGFLRAESDPSRSSLSAIIAAVAMAGASLVLGPGSACLLASWLRDEALFGDWIWANRQRGLRDEASSEKIMAND